ncbi:MAG TPA: rRNA maturation RNase YbeY [Flavobacterium sp.]|jgi:rRNA maturation RNase YbeY
MVSFNYETNFELSDEDRYAEWITAIIVSEGKKEGEINYVFCDDEYLHNINLEYLKHDELTDIISFDYSVGNELHGDIFISIERVRENALEYNVSEVDELNRVMAHGVLHYCGYKDKSTDESEAMRRKENEKMSMFKI